MQVRDEDPPTMHALTDVVVSPGGNDFEGLAEAEGQRLALELDLIVELITWRTPFCIGFPGAVLSPACILALGQRRV